MTWNWSINSVEQRLLFSFVVKVEDECAACSGELICDHINSHLDNSDSQHHVIRMAGFAPWNGELKSEFMPSLPKLIHLFERRPCEAAVHKQLCEILQEGKSLERDLKKFFDTTLGEGAEITRLIKHAYKQERVTPRILLQSQPRHLAQHMGEFVLSDIVCNRI